MTQPRLTTTSTRFLCSFELNENNSIETNFFIGEKEKENRRPRILDVSKVVAVSFQFGIISIEPKQDSVIF